MTKFVWGLPVSKMRFLCCLSSVQAASYSAAVWPHLSLFTQASVLTGQIGPTGYMSHASHCLSNGLMLQRRFMQRFRVLPILIATLVWFLSKMNQKTTCRQSFPHQTSISLVSMSVCVEYVRMFLVLCTSLSFPLPLSCAFNGGK